MLELVDGMSMIGFQKFGKRSHKSKLIYSVFIDIDYTIYLLLSKVILRKILPNLPEKK